MIHVVVLATNLYLPLGIRLIKNLERYYKGETPLHVHIHSDKDVYEFLGSSFSNNVSWIETSHAGWQEATNSKFTSIIEIINSNKIDEGDLIYYMDADTNVLQDFTEFDIVGSLVGAEHFNRYLWEEDGSKMPFERFPDSKAYISPESNLPAMYYQGAFFGGELEYVKLFCKTLIEWQKRDKELTPPFEPAVNDESYINKFFHISPPELSIKIENFPFKISCKAGIKNHRDAKATNRYILSELRVLKDDYISIQNGNIVPDDYYCDATQIDKNLENPFTDSHY